MPERVEIYTAARRAEFLLSNAVDEEDYAWTREEVRAMGLDPDAIPHYIPSDSDNDRDAPNLPFPSGEGAGG